MASAAKSVTDLARVVGARLVGDGLLLVNEVTHDSRRATRGSIYVALRGVSVDGHDFAASAVSNGAVAICVDHEMDLGVAELVVDDTRSVLGRLAAAVYAEPSRDMDVIGVTGTNGKTTVTHYIESLASECDVSVGLIGTIQTRYAGLTIESSLTTPEASDFQSLLADMRDSGVVLAAVEVSSHALDLGRVDATRFSVAAFTNLSQDHLDFHGDMASYRSAKERLFTDYEVGTSVINIDDPVGAEIATHSHSNRLLRVGSGGDVSVDRVEVSSRETRFRITSPWGTSDVVAPIIGAFNVANLAIAVTCLVASGIEFDDVLTALPNLSGVPGRYEVVSGDDPIVVIVDYAHTPEGVEVAVETARALGEGRVIGLIGAGGDRDKAKRPAMGMAIAGADLAIVTSDNPRSEDPQSIAASVASGMPRGSKHVVEIDRRQAIGRAIEAADDGDIVLILGRGHEPHQQIGGQRFAFDDREVAAAALQRRRMSADSEGESGSMAQ